MAYFNWGTDLDVGHPMIDEDHRKLVDLVNELHTATSRGEGREVVGPILDALASYTEDHFRREESQMEHVRYAHLAEHKRQHARLLEHVLQLQARYEAGQLTVAAQVSALLRDWLSIHIRREDKKLAAALKE